ncbi:MAG TPA: glycerate kinase [Flavitalea sp.]|nr:glycerate kinase [Flavitalea sp.]
MHFLIAPNAFKNTLTAGEAAAAILEGFQESGIPFTYELFPVGDGGDGTGDLLVDRFKGTFVSASAHDPIGRTINAKYGLIDSGDTAIIEMTYASGIKLLEKSERDPLHASSFGTGELIRHALEQGARNLLITMGGSATVDGATGIMRALGFRFLNDQREELLYIKDMGALHSIDNSSVDDLSRRTSFTVLCDVKNIICGPEGAAAVYGPQKGADHNAVIELDGALQRLAEILERTTGKSIFQLTSGGTAGGAAAGLYALLDATLFPGIDYFLDLCHFGDALDKADVVITGEGGLDEQTMQGKAPFGVARRAKAAGKKTVCIAGTVPDQPGLSMKAMFDLIIGTSQPGSPVSHTEAFKNLKETAGKAAKQLVSQS